MSLSNFKSETGDEMKMAWRSMIFDYGRYFVIILSSINDSKFSVFEVDTNPPDDLLKILKDCNEVNFVNKSKKLVNKFDVLFELCSIEKAFWRLFSLCIKEISKCFNDLLYIFSLYLGTEKQFKTLISSLSDSLPFKDKCLTVKLSRVPSLRMPMKAILSFRVSMNC